MCFESEVENFKKNFLEEVGCFSLNKEAQKRFRICLKRQRNLDFFEVHIEIPRAGGAFQRQLCLSPRSFT